MNDFVNIDTAFILYWILMSCVVFYFPRYDIAVGQVLRATPVKQFYLKNKKTFKSLQEVSGIMFIASISSQCWQLLCFRSSVHTILASKFQVLTTMAFFSFISVYSHWTRMERIL